MRFFFYGTLLDPDVRRAVLRDRAPRVVEPALLRGWRRVGLAGATYPIVRRQAGAAVEGILMRGLDRVAARRLAHYEGGDYGLRRVTVAVGSRVVAAHVFVPVGRPPRTRSGPWNFATWRRRHKRATLLTLLRAVVPSAPAGSASQSRSG